MIRLHGLAVFETYITEKESRKAHNALSGI